jgi:Zn-finger nucleic acid-binding protein
MSRHCPICPSKPLRTTQAGGIPVATCDHCRGHWLEHDQLERLTPAWKFGGPWASLREDAPRRCPHAKHHVPASRDTCGMCGRDVVHCPSCAAPLSQVRMQACAVEVCGQCQGLWLDASELELLRQAPKSSLRPLMGGAAVAAAVTAATVAYSQAGGAPVGSTGQNPVVEATEVVLEVATDVAAEGALHSIASGAGTVIEVAAEGASTVGSAIGDMMAAVLGAIADAFN